MALDRNDGPHNSPGEVIHTVSILDLVIDQEKRRKPTKDVRDQIGITLPDFGERMPDPPSRAPASRYEDDDGEDDGRGYSIQM